MKLKHLAIAVTLALGVSNAAFANDTSSAIRGSLTSASGQQIPNAKVEILHVPSGTTSTTTTNDSGAFASSGLRVGGPYKITITSSEGSKTYDGIFLSLGDAYRLSAKLEAEQVERIAVTGAVIAGGGNTGSSSYFSAEDIANSPTFNRDIKEIARMNPYATMLPGTAAPLSIAGANPKFNSVSIDGVGVNDDFGLNGSGYPTQRSPISIDAIEQISVDVAPFDASQGGFSGGRINTVTKSGTNELHGTLAYEKMSDSWAGKPKSPYNGEKTKLDFERDTIAGTLGGAIIQDELFFFASYESSKEPTQAKWGPAGAGAANNSNVTLEEYNQIAAIAQDVYGIDIGGWSSSPDIEDENILIKLDWNINDTQRVAVTYNKTEGNSISNQSNGTATLQLDTNWYDYQQNMDLYRFSLFSDWNDDLSSEIYVSRKTVDSISGLLTKEYGDIDVKTATGTLNFGPDSNRHANQLSNTDLKIGAKFNYLLDDHQIKFGGEYDKLDVFNIFVRNSLGTWKFENIEDFENQVATQFFYENAYTNVPNDAAADFSLGMANLYVQDNWYITDTVELAYGLRYERYLVSDEPTLNENFVDRYGYSNQENLDGLDILLPRVDIKWTATEDVSLRAGFGRFSGGKPNVWISNSFSNDGYTLVQFDSRSLTEEQYLENVDVKNVPDAVLGAMFPGDGNTNSIDPNYKIASDWIARVGVDYNFDVPVLGENFFLSAEVMRKWMTDNSQWKDISRCVSGQTAAGINVYEPCDPTAPSGHYDIMLTNEDVDGKAWIYTLALDKAWDNGISMQTSYTHQDIEEGNPGTSTTATSNYQYNIVRDRNMAEMGTADYEIEHSFKIALGYSHEFFAGYASKFNLFFQRRSSSHFSYVMGMSRDTDFGDQSTFSSGSAYLPYIPTGADDPNYSPESTISFDDLMENIRHAGLEGYAGGFAPKGAGNSPWVNTLDFQYQQEIPGFYAEHKGTVYFNIENLLNLIDSSQGQVLRQNFTNKTIVDFGGLDSEGRYIYESPRTPYDKKNWDTWEDEQSAWRLKIGVKYSF